MKRKTFLFILMTLCCTLCLSTFGAHAPELVVSSKVNNNPYIMMGYAIWYGGSNAPVSFDRSWDLPDNPTAAEIANCPSGSNNLRRIIYADNEAAALKAGNVPGIAWKLMSAKPTPAQPETSTTPYSYHSNDPELIKKHIKEFRDLGVDIIVPDLTNSLEVLIPENWDYSHSTEPNAFIQLVETLSSYDLPVENSLVPQTKLWIVPILGAQDKDDCTWQDNGKSTGFERGLQFILEQHKKHPEVFVQYNERLLVMVYHGPTQNEYDKFSGETNTILENAFFTDPSDGTKTKMSELVVLRHTSALLESAASVNGVRDHRIDESENAENPPFVRAKSGVWSWIDRLYNEGLPNAPALATSWFSSYTKTVNVEAKDCYEFVCAPITSRSDLWSPKDPISDQNFNCKYIPSRGGLVLNTCLSFAAKVRPTFVFIPHYNFFVAHDSGFSSDTTNDIEPNNVWGNTVYNLVKTSIANFKQAISSQNEVISNIAIRGLTGTGLREFTVGFILDGSASQRVAIKAIGPSLGQYFPDLNPATAASYFNWDPVLSLYKAGENPYLIAENQKWNEACSKGRAINTIPRSKVASDEAFVYRNCESLLRSMESTAMRSDEPAILTDLPANSTQYTIIVNDENSTVTQGRMTHVRLETMDKITPRVYRDISARSFIDPANEQSTINFDFTLSKETVIAFIGRGPSLTALPGIGFVGLKKPQLKLYKRVGNTIVPVTFDDSQSGGVRDRIERNQYWALQAADVAYIKPLESGTYSLVLSNADDTASDAGVGMLQVIPSPIP